MKRYLVFAGLAYYPSHGWLDFRSSHDSLDDAIAAGEEALRSATSSADDLDWWHVVDIEAGAVVAPGDEVNAWECEQASR